VEAWSHSRGAPGKGEREFFIDNLLVRIHSIIVMIRWTGLAPWEFEGSSCSGVRLWGSLSHEHGTHETVWNLGLRVTSEKRRDFGEALLVVVVDPELRVYGLFFAMG